MADPATLAMLSIGSSIAGGGISAVGAEMGGQSAQAMYNYQAGIQLQNARIARQNAEYARITGGNQAAVAGMAGRARMGQIITAQAASGLNVNTGSAKKVQSSQDLVTNIDETTIRSNAAKRAYDFDVQAVQATEQSQVDQASGANARTVGDLGVASSIIGTAGSVSARWLQGLNEGTFNPLTSRDTYGVDRPMEY